MDATKIHQFVIHRKGPQGLNRIRRGGEPLTLLEEYDPYIAGLIRKLQHEVRDERSERRWQYPQSIR
jgi:hypothetical protein